MTEFAKYPLVSFEWNFILPSNRFTFALIRPYPIIHASYAIDAIQMTRSWRWWFPLYDLTWLTRTNVLISLQPVWIPIKMMHYPSNVNYIQIPLHQLTLDFNSMIDFPYPNPGCYTVFFQLGGEELNWIVLSRRALLTQMCSTKPFDSRTISIQPCLSKAHSNFIQTVRIYAFNADSDRSLLAADYGYLLVGIFHPI